MKSEDELTADNERLIQLNKTPASTILDLKEERNGFRIERDTLRKTKTCPNCGSRL